MFEHSHSALRAADERVQDLRHRAQHHAVLKAVNADRRRRATEAALAALRAELAEFESRAATAWTTLTGRLGDA